MDDNFLRCFPLTQVNAGAVPQCLRSVVRNAGVYGNGLLTVLDIDLSAVALKSWDWLVGGTAIPILATALGDVFYSDEQGVSFLEVQRGTSELIDDDIDWVLSEFLVQPDIMRDVLHKTRFDRLMATHGALEYGQTFVLSPWEILGGSPQDKNYSMGDLVVYLDMVGQFLGNNRNSEDTACKSP